MRPDQEEFYQTMLTVTKYLEPHNAGPTATVAGTAAIMAVKGIAQVYAEVVELQNTMRDLVEELRKRDA